MRRKVWAILLMVIYCVVMMPALAQATDILVTSTVTVSATVPGEVEETPTSTTTTSTSSGGGGGAILPAVATQLVINGVAYPLARVTLLKNGVVNQIVYADLEAKFNINLSGLEAGWFNLALIASDSDGNQSATLSLPVYVTYGAITTVNGLLLAPTLRLDRLRVLAAESVNVSGQTAPLATLRISVKAATNNELTVQADQRGWYYYKVETRNWALGNYLFSAKSNYKNLNSPESTAVSLMVTTRDEVALPERPTACQIRADFNSDCKINLVDFSILAYWYKRPNVPARLDLQKNGVIDLADFSIMAYYWTG